MKRSLLVLALLCGAATAAVAGTGPDVAVSLVMYEPFTVNPAHRARAGEEVLFSASIRNHGPGQPSNVVVEVDVPGEVFEATSAMAGTSCTQSNPVRCTNANPQITTLAGTIHVRTRLTAAGTFRATARVSHAQTDPFPANDVATWDVEVGGGPDLETRLTVIPSGPFAYWAQPRIEPGTQDSFTASASNVAATVATNVRLVVSMPNGGTIERFSDVGDADCAIVANEVICTRATLAKGEGFNVRVHYRSPDRASGGDVIMHSRVTAAESDYDPSSNAHQASLVLVRHIEVENASDEGPGSLRQAILDSQELCTEAPCRIKFGIGYFRPRTPLPELRGFVILEGFNVTVIDGTQQAEGAGIRIGDGCEIHFRGFHVFGFPGHAIEVRGNHRSDRCAGRSMDAVLIEGNRIAESGRGIVIDDSDHVVLRFNGIFNHRRAGIFATRAFYVNVDRNQIQYNGASGVFLQTTYGADVTQNKISDNGEWGVARSGRGEVTVSLNSIAGNPNPAIDHELDFDTENHFEDVLRLPNKPMLTSATYDPATQLTYVNGHIASHDRGGSTFRVELFVNGVGGPQLERYLGHVFVAGGVGNFTFTVREDLTGKFITSTLTRSRIIGFGPSGERPLSHPTSIPGDTSEVSNSIRVNR